ncbi:MAG TPA: polymer-forming cytoskeletal protein [Burkholderiales bacterium]|jgi:cytoskeletal protein CcmA (bactofilin family)|nr:polymer-forming cytoskeletal protein [Burkholderiales bacterium]
MLQKDGLFRRRDEGILRTPPAAPQVPQSSQPAPSAPLSPSATDASKHLDKGGERKEARLTVGPEIKMKGVEVTDCDTLVVEGRIEATLDSRVLQIAEHGVFSGTVSVDLAEIHGRLEGELTVRKQLVIHATGKVNGKVRYAKIKVDEGAELSGEIAVLDRTATGGPPRGTALSSRPG